MTYSLGNPPAVGAVVRIDRMGRLFGRYATVEAVSGVRAQVRVHLTGQAVRLNIADLGGVA